MATYDSIHTGEQVDEAVGIVLNNKGKGSATQPIYLDADGQAQNVNVDANPTDSSANLVQSGGVFTQLSTKYPKADISTDPNLGTSDTVIPSQGAVKSYVDTELAGKQDVITAGDGIIKTGNTLSISTDNDFMTAGKLDNKWSHFVSGLDMGYGTETIEKMENAKRSTFDRSKFTIVGSPNITDDGIASGFSSGNYLTISNFLKGKTNYQVNLSFIISLSSVSPYVFAEGNGNVGGFSVYYSPGGSLYVRVGSSATSNLIATVNDGDLIDLSVIITNGTTGIVKWNKNGVAQTDYTLDMSGYSAFAEDFLYLGARSSGVYFTGSIDLKQFSITVDGVEVFSGNKTGIDTIKADDYTVEGTPTITADGIASGFSNSNYLTKILTNNLTSTMNIEVCVNVSNVSTASGSIFSIANSDNSANILYLGFYSSKIRLNYSNSVNTNTNTTDVGTPKKGLNYFRIKINNNNIDVYYSTSGVDYELLKTYSDFYINNLAFVNIGIARGLASALNNVAVDLNSFKIYIDGDLVYQPCLKIPYTLTKDGKKIVDYNYKSRVEDEYGQAGFTPYYTLDTESRGNYTVAGSPTISSDFVASGFSSSNYLTISTGVTLSKNTYFKIYTRFKTPATFTKNGRFLGRSANFNFGHTSAGKISGVFIGANLSTSSLQSLSTDTVYDAILIYDSTGFYTKYKAEGESTYTSTTPVEVTSDSTVELAGYIGNQVNDSTAYFTGSIDLKEFKIYVDNKLAYQAVTPPNYTMATVKESTIVGSYENGINKWTKLANLTCKQQGSCTSGTAVTFTKPYIDTNYALSVPYTSGTKTKTGFTPSATGDWIANGKVDLNA